MAARSLPCATRAIKDERLAVDSPTQIPKRARHCYSVQGCLQHPGRCRSLDPGLLLLILTTWTTPADILVHVARLNCQATPLPVTRSVHEARCPVESKCTTCPETERLEFHPLPKQRSLACLPTTKFDVLDTSKPPRSILQFTCSALFTTYCVAQCDTAPEIGLVGASAT